MPKLSSKDQATDIAALLRARNPLLWIVSREEARVEGYVFEAAAAAGYTARTWDVAAGCCGMDGQPIRNLGSADPGEMLDQIATRARNIPERGVWIMRDLPPWLIGPIGLMTNRKLRNLVRMLPTVARERAQAVVILSPSADVPPELANHTTVIEWGLPTREEIALIFDDAIAALPAQLQATAAPNGTRDAAIDAAVGLSGEEAAACYARSLVQLRRIDPASVAHEKRRVIARERVLEWYDPIPGGLDAVGGLDMLKTWLISRRSAYSPAARAYGLPAPKGALLAGVPGCLTGDTIINVCRKQRPGGYKGIRLDALFYRFNNRHEEGSCLGLYEKSKRWDLKLPTQAHCYKETDKYIGFNKIENVLYSGIKIVYRLTTDHGASVKATSDHKFLTPHGYVALNDLAVGDELFAHQNSILIDCRTTGRNGSKPLRFIHNVGNHPFARRREVNGLDYTSHPLSTLVVETSMNAMCLEDFLWALHGDTAGLKFLPQGTEVHHRDPDRDNNTLSNLEPLTKEAHARLHMLEAEGSPNRFKYAPRLQKITSIEKLGPEPTYDIQMAAPNHNFVANGLIVHNCGKSLTAKAIAAAWGIPLLRLDLGALKSKFVGESEGNLRRAFSVIEALGRAVIWLDEIEKAFVGATEGGADGGVSSDALGATLSWMQERQGEAFVIATANDVSKLPPELLRKGRFDELWFVDLPNATERAQIVIAALAAHGRKPKDDLWGYDVAAATEGFTGSEIAALIPDAMYAAFGDGGREIDVRDILDASRSVVPLSKSAVEKITALRAWAVGRARAATTPEKAAVAVSNQTRSIDL
jgi:ATPase family associated with various cellular activities (AAA)/Intein splicing domain/HNH endonuclease